METAGQIVLTGKIRIFRTLPHIIHAFGFTDKNKLNDGDYSRVENLVKEQFNIGFVANVIDTSEIKESSVLISEGEPLIMTAGLDALSIPFGKDKTKNIFKIINNGLIDISFTDKTINISITKIENKVLSNNTLKLDIYLLQESIARVTDSWAGVIESSKKTIKNYTTVEKVQIIGTSICAVIILFSFVVELAAVAVVALSTDSAASELSEGTAEITLEKAIKDSNEAFMGVEGKYTEVVEGMRDLFAKDLKEAQTKFKQIIKELLATGQIDNKRNFNKLCVVRDMTDEEKVAFGGSGQYYNNPTIFSNEATELKLDSVVFPNLTLEGNALKGEFTEQSEKTLTDNWVRTIYHRNIEYYEKKGIELEDILREFKILRDKIDRVKDLASKIGTELDGRDLNKFGNLSLQSEWNIENCAEIWACRNALLIGIKIENIAMRCVYFNNLKYAEPCLNCQETFMVEINEGRDLLN